MKKFKGGLYADLSNYNTTLPNTNVLLNFFKSNPIGYRSGGMVRGIAGGNPTGMRVTGGFLANAQKMQYGGEPYDPRRFVPTSTGDMTQSAYYRDKDVKVPFMPKKKLSKKDLVRLGILKEVRKRDGKKMITTYVPTGETYIPPEEYYEQFSGFRKDQPTVQEELTESEMMETPMSDNDAKLLQDISRLRATKPEGYEAQIQQILAKPESEGGISEFTKKQMALGTATPEEKKSDTTTAYTGGEGSSRFGEGITGLTQDEINKIKEKRKETEIERELGQIPKPDLTKKDKTQSSTADLIDDKIEESKLFKKNKNKKTTETNIVSVDGQPKNMFDMTPEDWMSTFQGMSNKDEKQVTSDDKSLSDRIAKALNPEAKDKGKEAPAWAMPLMMAGLQMAASNNPDMLGALGEGGIKGLEEYSKMQKEKREDEKYEQEMSLKKAGLIFDEERIKLSKDQLNQNQQRLEYDIASDAMKSYQQLSLEYQKMAQTGEISEADRQFKYENLAATMDMEANRLSQDLLKFKADYELKLEGMDIDERKLELDWYKTETGNLLNSKLITSQIVKNNAQAEAAGFETGSVVDLEIGGKDMKVQIYRDKDGFHIKELGLATDKNSTKLLQAYMKSNPYWFEEYEEDPDAFFEKLEAVKDMSDILQDESKDIDLSNIDKID